MNLLTNLACAVILRANLLLAPSAVISAEPPAQHTRMILATVGRSIIEIKFVNNNSSVTETPLFRLSSGAVSSFVTESKVHRIFVTSFNANNGYGSVFKINLNGTHYRVLHEFKPQHVDLETLQPNESGIMPVGNIDVNKHGTIFGCCYLGGSSGTGLIYSLQSDGSNFRVLHEFPKLGLHDSNTEGAEPLQGVLLSEGGSLYGICSTGGTYGKGTIFKFTPSSMQYKVVYNFPQVDKHYRNIQGSSPKSLVLLANGTLIGTTQSGGKYGGGTLFQVLPDGSNFQVLHAFGGTKTDGINPGTIAITQTGIVYGVTGWGGKGLGGILYEYNPLTARYIVLHNFSFSKKLNQQVGFNPRRLSVSATGDIILDTTMAGRFNHGALLYYSTANNVLSVLLPFRQ